MFAQLKQNVTFGSTNDQIHLQEKLSQVDIEAEVRQHNKKQRKKTQTDKPTNKQIQQLDPVNSMQQTIPNL